MVPLSQGALAAKNGKIFENYCVNFMTEYGIEVIKHKDFLKREKAGNLPETYVIKGVPFTTVYNTKGATEFVIVKGNRKVRVENKYQQASGSVDEKFPYTLLNAIFAYPEDEVIIVIDGGGYRKNARQWVVDRVNENWLNFKEHRDIKVMTMNEFQRWFYDNFV